MLSKLIKHEFRATFRLLIPLFILLFILSIVDRIVLSLDIFHGVLEIIPILITFAFVISIATVIIATFILMIMRFYKNLTSDEGYLMFTLPVHTRQLIHSKFLVFFTWTIACILAVIAALLIALARPESISELWNSFKQVLKGLNNAMEGYGTIYRRNHCFNFSQYHLSNSSHIYLNCHWTIIQWTSINCFLWRLYMYLSSNASNNDYIYIYCIIGI